MSYTNKCEICDTPTCAKLTKDNSCIEFCPRCKTGHLAGIKILSIDIETVNEAIYDTFSGWFHPDKWDEVLEDWDRNFCEAVLFANEKMKKETGE